MSTPMDDWMKVFHEALDTEFTATSGTFEPQPDVTLTGAKITSWMPISQELLCDYGYCDHDHSKDPKPRISRRTRLCWWLSDHKPHVHLGPCPREEDTW